MNGWKFSNIFNNQFLVSHYAIFNKIMTLSWWHKVLSMKSSLIINIKNDIDMMSGWALGRNQTIDLYVAKPEMTNTNPHVLFCCSLSIHYSHTQTMTLLINFMVGNYSYCNHSNDEPDMIFDVVGTKQLACTWQHIIKHKNWLEFTHSMVNSNYYKSLAKIRNGFNMTIIIAVFLFNYIYWGLVNLSLMGSHRSFYLLVMEVNHVFLVFSCYIRNIWMMLWGVAYINSSIIVGRWGFFALHILFLCVCCDVACLQVWLLKICKQNVSNFKFWPQKII